MKISYNEFMQNVFKNVEKYKIPLKMYWASKINYTI